MAAQQREKSMARIPILSEDDPALGDDTRTFLANAAKSRGRLLNIYRAMANRPQAAEAFSNLIRTVYRSGSTLPARQAELAYLTATVVNDCYY
jgi:alkylhydroperoxidase family enzyme